MRYLIVNYRQVMIRKGFRMEPQTDEIVSVSKKLKTQDLQRSGVILDFKNRQVVLSTLNGTTIPKDWDRIVGYYHRFYKDIIEKMLEDHGHPVDIKPVDEPVKEQD